MAERARGGAAVRPPARQRGRLAGGDRKSTRLNSSHLGISYAVFCLKKKNTGVRRVYHRISAERCPVDNRTTVAVAGANTTVGTRPVRKKRWSNATVDCRRHSGINRD